VCSTKDEVDFVLNGSFGREAVGYLTRKNMGKGFYEKNKKRMGRILSFGRFMAN